VLASLERCVKQLISSYTLDPPAIGEEKIDEVSIVPHIDLRQAMHVLDPLCRRLAQ
jgi:hypothetical protein